jgi:hypothetical protein
VPIRSVNHRSKARPHHAFRADPTDSRELTVLGNLGGGFSGYASTPAHRTNSSG